jgi:hypothetical protein
MKSRRTSNCVSKLAIASLLIGASCASFADDTPEATGRFVPEGSIVCLYNGRAYSDGALLRINGVVQRCVQRPSFPRSPRPTDLVWETLPASKAKRR